MPSGNAPRPALVGGVADGGKAGEPGAVEMLVWSNGAVVSDEGHVKNLPRPSTSRVERLSIP